MKYLVLHSFRCFGKTLRKGEVVDESAIRSPRLRRSEGKIVPAVEEPLSKPDKKPADSAVTSSEASGQPVVAAPAVQKSSNKAKAKEESKPVRLNFG